MKINNYYTVYGLNIKSDIQIHNELSLENIPIEIHVNILLGNVNKNVNSSNINYGQFKFSKDKILINIENVAHYEVSNGSQIIIEPYDNANIEEIKKYLLGSALGLLLFQRNIIALHGGAISINNKGFILSGDIGAGKTTVVGSLIKKGYDFLSDDVSAITYDITNGYNIHHSFPHQKLCKNTAEAFGYNTSQLYQIDKVKDKYYSPLIKTFCKEPKKLHSIIYLSCEECDDVICSEILGVNKFKLILSNIYRKEFIPSDLISNDFIKECLNLSKSIKVYKITRPKNKNSVDKIINIIEALA